MNYSRHYSCPCHWIHSLLYLLKSGSSLVWRRNPSRKDAHKWGNQLRLSSKAKTACNHHIMHGLNRSSETWPCSILYKYVSVQHGFIYTYLIFVISFTQTGFSKTKFYTQKSTKITKNTKMSLKKSYICIFFTHSGKIYIWQKIFTQTCLWCLWQIWGMLWTLVYCCTVYCQS